MKKYNFSITGGIIVLAFALLFGSCKKETPPPSSKELDLINFDSLGYWPGYIACGNTGNVDADWLNFTFATSSIEGEVTITDYRYRIENNTPGALPITSMSMWSDKDGHQNVAVTGPYVTFSNMNNFVPVGDNGRLFSLSLTYSGIGRNNVVPGQTTCQVILESVTYKDRFGLYKTKQINKAGRKKMLTHSFLSFSYYYIIPNVLSGLRTGIIQCYEKSFSVITASNTTNGSIALESIPLKYKTSGCIITGSAGMPNVYMAIRQNATGQYITSGLVLMSCTRINDSVLVVAIPPSYASITNKNGITATFYMDVASIDSAAPDPFLRVGLSDIKRLSFLDKITNTRYTTQNEDYLYWRYYWNQYQTPISNLDDYWEIRR